MKNNLQNYFPAIDPGEVAAMRDLFSDLARNAPYSGGYEPNVIGGCFHEDDCRQDLFEKAAADDYAIFQAVCGYVQKRRWPRMTKSAKFFLRERLEAAGEYCRAWLQSYRLPANMDRTCLPSEALRYVELLVSEYWGDTGCRIWVEQNASQYVDRPNDFDR